MAMNQKTIFVYDDFSTDQPILMGSLYVNVIKGGEDDNSISIELAVQTAVRFGISKSDAEVYAENILKIVRDNWEKLAAGCDLTRRQIEEMRPAFSACYE